MRSFESMKVLLYSLLFAGFVLAQDTENEGAISLEALVEGQIGLPSVLDQKLSVRTLVESFKIRTDLSASVKNRFLNRYKSKLKSLLDEEKGLLRAKKRVPKTSKYLNKFFYGEAEEAADATLEQLDAYELILINLRDLYEQEKIDRANYNWCLENIENLRFFHANNRQISLEFSRSSESETYGNRPFLHYAEHDVPFQLKAQILYDILLKSYMFAREHDYLVEFFRDALAKGAGCLEARFARVARWHKGRVQYMRSLDEMNPEEAAVLLPVTAVEAVNSCIESHFEVLQYLDHDNKWDYALQITDYFEGKFPKVKSTSPST